MLFSPHKLRPTALSWLLEIHQPKSYLKQMEVKRCQHPSAIKENSFRGPFLGDIVFCILLKELLLQPNDTATKPYNIIPSIDVPEDPPGSNCIKRRQRSCIVRVVP